MAIVTLDGGQSSSAIAGQTTTYIIDKILTRMPAVPDSLVSSELQDTLRHFYQFSTGWREIIGPIDVIAGQDTYYLNPIDSFKQVQYVLSTWMFPSPNGAQFPARLQLVPRKIVGPDTGPPSSTWMKFPSEAVLYPVPDKNYLQTLYAYVVLVPVISVAGGTTNLPEIAITQHLDALMWGTMWRLHRMKGKTWTDKALAMEYKRDYWREISRVRDEVNRSYSGIDTPFQYPPFAPRHWVGGPWAVAD